MPYLLTGTTFCGNSPLDPVLLSLVQNEVPHLSSILDDFIFQDKEEKDRLKTQLLAIEQSLLQLYKKVEQIENKVHTLEQQVEDLSVYSKASEDDAKHPRFFGVLNRNEYFTGRRKELEDLGKAFENASTESNEHGPRRTNKNIRGICGLGGCGKSCLALEYAWENMERYPGGIFVINGESDELIRASLHAIHQEYVVIAPSNQHNNETQLTFDCVLKKTLSWLGNLREKWLLLVDNMDEKELGPCAMKVFFGQWKCKAFCDILVTSRRSSPTLCEDLDLPPENYLELGPFSSDESVEFLKKRAGVQSSCNVHIREELAKELGGLPLALEQAAAYIKTLNCSIESYLKQYRLQKTKLLNAKSAKPRTELYSKERLSVQTTWLLNLRYIEDNKKDEKLGRAATLFTKVAAFLSPDEIPIEILNVGAPAIRNIMELRECIGMPLGVQQIVEELVKFSLFKQKSDCTLSIHRLVQETIRDHFVTEGETDSILVSCIRMMHKSFLNCVSSIDFLYEVKTILEQDSNTQEKTSPMEQFWKLIHASASANFDVKQWEKLSKNAYQLVCNLLEKSCLKSCFFSEETARLFCEAALHCYSLNMEIIGQNLHQFCLDIICGINNPMKYYKLQDDLQKLTRMLLPYAPAALLSLKVTGNPRCRRENVHDSRKSVQNEALMPETVNIISSKAKEAFAQGDIETSAALYTEIVQALGFSTFRGSARNQVQKSPFSVGEFLCYRGIAYLRMGEFESAVNDFIAATYVNSEYFRGYYWKVYGLCKLVESGKTRFTSRAQASMAVLQFKFGDSKSHDIRKLKEKFPGILENIKYVPVSDENDLKELERSLTTNSQSLTIILNPGLYCFKAIGLFGGHYNFVCPPGGWSLVHCTAGIHLKEGSFLFENVDFTNISPWSSASHPHTGVDTFSEGSCNLDTLMLGWHHGSAPHLTTETWRNCKAFIEADNILALDIDHCDVVSQPFTGISLKFEECNNCNCRGVSVTSSNIVGCSGTGVEIQGIVGQDCYIHLIDNSVSKNLYGIKLRSQVCFHLEKNEIFGHELSGLVASQAGKGKIIRNFIDHNRQHGILLYKVTHTVVKENIISSNYNWGIVCAAGSTLECTENVFEGNLCGGLRIMFNGAKSVSIDHCNFRENEGPSVFPSSSDQLSLLELEKDHVFPTGLKALWLIPFLEHQVVGNIESCSYFKLPEVHEKDKVSEDSNMSSVQPEQNLCCTCHKESDNTFECPECHIAKYCNKLCFDQAKAIHGYVCKSIIEPNNASCSCVLRFFEQTAVQGLDQQRTGISMCVITTLGSMPFYSDSPNYVSPHQLCLVCPEANCWTSIASSSVYYFILKHGIHVPHRMTNAKAACILAHIESDSQELTVYTHRIFPLDKVPEALKLVDKMFELLQTELDDGITRMILNSFSRS